MRVHAGGRQIGERALNHPREEVYFGGDGRFALRAENNAREASWATCEVRRTVGRFMHTLEHDARGTSGENIDARWSRICSVVCGWAAWKAKIDFTSGCGRWSKRDVRCATARWRATAQHMKGTRAGIVSSAHPGYSVNHGQRGAADTDVQDVDECEGRNEDEWVIDIEGLTVFARTI